MWVVSGTSESIRSIEGRVSQSKLTPETKGISIPKPVYLECFTVWCLCKEQWDVWAIAMTRDTPLKVAQYEQLQADRSTHEFSTPCLVSLLRIKWVSQTQVIKKSFVASYRKHSICLFLNYIWWLLRGRSTPCSITLVPRVYDFWGLLWSCFILTFHINKADIFLMNFTSHDIAEVNYS